VVGEGGGGRLREEWVVGEGGGGRLREEWVVGEGERRKRGMRRRDGARRDEGGNKKTYSPRGTSIIQCGQTNLSPDA
jgi:hypothetical protein